MRMEEKGIFRSAIGGFHKNDVLSYIDKITGEWNEERVQLMEQAESASREMERVSEEARQAVAAARATEDEAAAKLEAMQEQLRGLTAELQEMTAQRDVAVTEKAALEEQLQQEQEKTCTATQEMMAAEERLQARDGEVATLRGQLEELQGQLTAYGEVLGAGEDIKPHVDGIVRPFIEGANRRADDTLTNVRTVLDALLGQLGELRDNVQLQQAALQLQKMESDAKLSDALDTWMDKIRRLAQDTAGRVTRFFR